MSWDWLDWCVGGAGGVFGVLTIAFGLSRASAFAERDVAPIWWFAFAIVGAVWAVAQIGDWILPVSTTVYLVNGGDEPREARLGDDLVCIPAKSYDGFPFRLSAPDSVTLLGKAPEPERRYRIGKGTWFINLSSVVVTADVYEQGGTVGFDAIFAPRGEALKVSSKFGQPFRLFTQLPMDRIYSPDGDVKRDSLSGPCPAASGAPMRP